MPERAKVTSIEALESFRASLIIYLEKAVRVLDEVSDDVLRTKLWVQSDRRVHWEREMRRRARVLEEKQQELFSAKLSNLQAVTQLEHMAVLKAQRVLDEAEARLNSVKQWNRQYDSKVEPMAKEVDKLRDILVGHMGKAVIYLAQTTKTLGDYADLSPLDTSVVKNQPREPDAAGTTVAPDTERGNS